MLTKKSVLKTVKEMPESFSVDDLLDRMIFLQKIENGLQQSKRNQVVSTVEAKARLKKRLK
ncbi:MAG TPA: hypothetical protein VE978_02895 [Chitinophagales bacterium]|nr:hypothetical protein [Chitinophagales bacterium]